MSEEYDKIAPFYDIVERKEYERISELILKILKKMGIEARKARVLDIGGGTGAIAIPLAQHCKKVVIYEPSQGMAQEALKKIRERSINNIEVSQQGLPAFKALEGYYHAVLLINNPFQYLLSKENQIKALKNIHKVLQENGVVILDFYFFPKLLLKEVKGGVREFIVEPYSIWQSSKVKINYEEETWLQEDFFIVKSTKGNDFNQKINITHSLKIMTINEVRLLFELTGFQVVDVLFSWKGNEEIMGKNKVWIIAKKSSKKTEN